MRKSYEMDMTRGPLLRSILIFTLPLLLSGVLQLLFNATDIVVVGQFAGANAMASVGSTTSLFNLLINAFIGISVGANVLVARYCGEKNYDLEAPSSAAPSMPAALDMFIREHNK